jgi:hypothetical protein
MLQVVIRFLTLDVVSEHPAIYWGLGSVWLLLLLAAFSSLRRLDVPTKAKVLWFLFILGVPLAGLGCYAVRCLIKGDWGFLKPFFAPSRTANKVAPR